MKKILLVASIALITGCSKESEINTTDDGFTVDKIEVVMSKQIARIGDKIEGTILVDINKEPNVVPLYTTEIQSGSNSTSLQGMGEFSIVLQSSDIKIRVKNDVNKKVLFSQDTTIKVYDDLRIDNLFEIINPSEFKNTQFIRINDPKVIGERSNYQSLVDNNISTFDGLYASRTYLYGNTNLDSVVIYHGNLDIDPTISLDRIKSDITNIYGGTVDGNNIDAKKIKIYTPKLTFLIKYDTKREITTTIKPVE